LRGKAKRSIAAAVGVILLVALAPIGSMADEAQGLDQREAKKAFGAIKGAIPRAPSAIGHYDKGCIAGAGKLSLNGPAWQVMRTSRNRLWGHPMLLTYIKKLSADAHKLDGWPGILVGDMAQPVGGPLLGGHASHQIGLDADLWYKPMPDRILSAEEREQLAPDNVVDQKALTIDRLWSDAHLKLLRRAASYPEVARIFVHPAVKRALCEASGKDTAWLHKIRPWYKHDDHFHVRLACPPGGSACVPQAEIQGDDGCGQELDDWFKKLRAVPKKPTKPPVPPKPMLVTDMPKPCQELLHAAERAEGVKASGN
jgi:penicillin-insensitive murein DD-endopeptidase